MTQETRNKIYGVVGSVGAIVVILGVVDQATAEEALGLTDQLLGLTGQAITLAATILAFVKSLPSRTTTVDVPKADVEAVLTTDGKTLAGPASPAPDGAELT